MDIAIKLHKLIERFEQCVAKFDPAIHKFKFGISYVQDEIQQIIQQIDTKDFSAHDVNIKLRSLNAYINDVERMINISFTSKDIVIDDNEPNPAKTGHFIDSIAMANGDILYYNSGPVSIEGIDWSIPNHAYKSKGEAIDDKYFYPVIDELKADVVVDDNYTYPDILTYGKKAINGVANVVIKNFDVLPEFSVKTFPNRQPTNHKDIVTLKISKPNNDTIIE